MKRTPLKRKTPLKAQTVSSRRKPMKRSQPRRDWSDARRLKIDGQVCRICGNPNVEAAHVVGREHDRPKPCVTCGGSGRSRSLYQGTSVYGVAVAAACETCEGLGVQKTLLVNPDHVIPLCRKHHTEYDAHSLDILGSLTREEEVEATRLVGLENARRRTAPSHYESGEG